MGMVCVCRATSMKTPDSYSTQSIFIGGMILVLSLIVVTAGWIASKI